MQKKTIVKLLLLALIIVSLVISAYNVINSYAVFYSEMSGQSGESLARWNIIINNTDITNGTTQNFTIDNLYIEENQNVEPNKIAPGVTGSFDIVIEPVDTQVSVRYDIFIDTSLLPSNVILDSVAETAVNNTIKQTAAHMYTGVIPVASIVSGYKNDIKMTFSWVNDETNNASDTTIGTIFGVELRIPIKVIVTQYLGEAF